MGVCVGIIRKVNNSSHRCMMDIVVVKSTRRRTIERQMGMHIGCGTVSSMIYSSFLRLPFGAGSSGVLVYVTVLVTTCRTLTGVWCAERGE